ncbi:unnamed protein product [Neospora caninum Liverpool]|uniref:Rhoptry protein ROP5 n=1 Tax=Neospora caninum (strain Liverpool) TaxID=572307 RepID=F0VPK2_NEOCL|nr:uncharacterized protein NCLIV_060730 [Neospora caninum Liverpool]CBZ55648.1 unnamed protein product [Neospora caninum Liverpool]CEL70390.1 TPA: rhoptry protein ROP5 [Neospora caninum Liverpool]|eukprot:XP_003885676.1 uncharacterized protein NCLIV_060730 [Neospora caninum Liverpool]
MKASSPKKLATWLVLLACLVWRSAAFQLSPPNSDANDLEVGDPGAAPENVAGEPRIGENSDFPEPRDEGVTDLRGGEGVAPRTPSTTRTHTRGGVVSRWFRRLRRGRDLTDGEESADESLPTPRASLRKRLGQHWRRVRAFFKGMTPPWLSGLPRRIRTWWSRQPDPSFHGVEPGSWFIRQILQDEQETIDYVRREMFQRHTLQVRAVSAALWRGDAATTVVSLLNQGARTLKVVEPLGRSDRSVVYRVQDVETNEPLALKVFTLPSEASRLELERLRDQEFAYQKLIAQSPEQAGDVCRLLLSYDAVAVQGQPPFGELSPGQSIYSVRNYFLVMPAAVMNLEIFHKAMDINVTFLPAAREEYVCKQILVELIRVAANLQARGLVHGRITSQHTLFMPDGRLMLGGTTALRRAGTYGPVSMVPATHAPPEFFSKKNRATAKYTHGLDAWQVGLVAFRIWCRYLPFGLATPGFNSAWTRPSMGVPGPTTIDFGHCVPMSEAVQRLIIGFLQLQSRKRLLPMSAIQTPEFRQLQLEISSRLSQAQGPAAAT